jgi:hypothetical protein
MGAGIRDFLAVFKRDCRSSTRLERVDVGRVVQGKRGGCGGSHEKGKNGYGEMHSRFLYKIA